MLAGLLALAGPPVGRGNDRCPEGDLPRAADLKAPLKDPGRALKIPATVVGKTESEQPPVQREGMFNRFSDLHRGLGVPDGLVEPAKLGEHIGKGGPRERRLDRGPPKALVAEVALEGDVPLEQWNRVGELAPSSMRHAQNGRGDHLDRAITEGPREAQGFLPESDGPVVVASGPALAHHEGGDPPQPVWVTERPGEPLRLLKVASHTLPLAKRDERVPDVDVEVDGQLERLPGLGEAPEGLERLLQVGHGLAIGSPRHGPEP